MRGLCERCWWKYAGRNALESIIYPYCGTAIVAEMTSATSATRKVKDFRK